ncbi:MAG: methyltransferase domain-containing protein [Mycobacteriaceae bacterium]|nr:methyltransferase domain-containing protein [Mycobacteriaceae bacterium]
MLDWDHNAYYHQLLLRQLPQPCHRALDVGCGAGTFAALIAQHVEHVDALDRSPTMIEAARLRTPNNVNCVLADALADPLPSNSYDAIVSLSALHHMPLQDALQRLAAALRPGGALAVVALPRTDLRHELPIEIVAFTGHYLFGAIFATARSLSSKSWLAKDSLHMTVMPIVDPVLTIRHVRRQAGEVLPGVRIRRLVFWRYLLLWQKPGEVEVQVAKGDSSRTSS